MPTSHEQLRDHPAKFEAVTAFLWPYRSALQLARKSGLWYNTEFTGISTHKETWWGFDQARREAAQYSTNLPRNTTEHSIVEALGLNVVLDALETKRYINSTQKRLGVEAALTHDIGKPFELDHRFKHQNAYPTLNERHKIRQDLANNMGFDIYAQTLTRYAELTGDGVLKLSKTPDQVRINKNSDQLVQWAIAVLDYSTQFTQITSPTERSAQDIAKNLDVYRELYKEWFIKRYGIEAYEAIPLKERVFRVAQTIENDNLAYIDTAQNQLEKLLGIQQGNLQDWVRDGIKARFDRYLR